MKKTAIRRLVVLTLCLTMVSLSLIGGTLAKYTSTFSATGTASVAKWVFNVTDKDNTTDNIQLAHTINPTAENTVAPNKIAPGTSGYFAIEVTSDSDVALGYTVSFTATGVPTNLMFYNATLSGTTVTKGNKITVDSGTYTVTNNGSLAIGSTTQATATEYIYWEWVYETANGDANDTTNGTPDTSTGNTTDMVLTVTVTGTQANPAVTNP